MACGIYKIVNISNNKVYIGSTKDFAKRKYTHFCRLRNNSHTNKHLQNSYNKYGEEKFKFEIIENLEFFDKSILLRLEQWYIDITPKESMYNQTFIADGGGSDTLGIPVYILDLSGNIINKFQSISEFSRSINRRNMNVKNNNSIVCGKYRVYSIDFYDRNKESILKLDNLTTGDRTRKIILDKKNSRLEKNIVVIDINRVIINRYNNCKELSHIMNISNEMVRRHINTGKFNNKLSGYLVKLKDIQSIKLQAIKLTSIEKSLILKVRKHSLRKLKKIDNNILLKASINDIYKKSPHLFGK